MRPGPGKHVAKLVYRGTGKSPIGTLRPPKPVPVPSPLDCVNFWVYGNNWSWVPDPATPQVEVGLRVLDASGQRHRLSLLRRSPIGCGR